MKAQATSANIQMWLESKDPRLIAWGAYFARENNDTAALELAAQLIEKSPQQGGLDPRSTSSPQHDAVSEILDALIQQNVSVSADNLGYLTTAFPPQAAILVSRLPATETSSILMQWYQSQENSYRLSRVAAMLLSKSPTPEFATSILADSEEQLLVYVTTDRSGFGSGFGSSSCGDGFGLRGETGWPELFRYGLEENNHRADPLLVEAGGDRITWTRTPTSRGFGSCYYVRPLSAETRHHLLAEMLGLPNSAMPWPTEQNVTIVWQSKDQFLHDLGAAIEAEDVKLRQTVRDFQARGLITPEEAKTVRPKLSVSIRYADSLKRPE
jgi:hypothetical protein